MEGTRRRDDAYIALCYIRVVKQVAFSKSALRTLTRILVNTARLIRSKIDQFATEPGSLANNVKPLKGESGIYRLRVGDWRILLTDDGEVIGIIKIAPRSGVYD